jgi:hypothetical protein
MGCPDRTLPRRLKLIYDEPFPKFTFNVNLRRYIKAFILFELLVQLPFFFVGGAELPCTLLHIGLKRFQTVFELCQTVPALCQTVPALCNAVPKLGKTAPVLLATKRGFRVRWMTWRAAVQYAVDDATWHCLSGRALGVLRVLQAVQLDPHPGHRIRQGLTLVHFMQQRKHLLRDAVVAFSDSVTKNGSR